MEQLLRHNWLVVPMKDVMVTVEKERLRQIVEGNVEVVVGRRGCCMTYVAQIL